MQPRQAAGAEEILAVDDKRRRRGMFRRFNLRRGGGLKAAKSAALSHQTWRKPSWAVITGVITASWSYSIISSPSSRCFSCGTPFAARTRA
jgi:hypothetical protein